MIERERIPQLIQTAQLLEVRGLCEVQESYSSNAKEHVNTGGEYAKTTSNSFLAGLLSTSVSAIKRSSSIVSDTTSHSNSSPVPSPVAKRQRTVAPPRPIPMLQSISQQVAAPKTSTFDITKAMGSSTKAFSAPKVHNTTFSSSSSVVSISCPTKSLPSSLENLLGSLNSVVMASSSAGNNVGENSTTNSSFEDAIDKDERAESSFGEMENSSGQCGEIEPDTIVEIKEEPLMDFDDDFGDDDDSETELRAMSDSSRGESFPLPLLAQHLASPNLLTASAKLRAAASQARTLSSGKNPLIAQVILSSHGPSTSPDMGPSSLSTNTDGASPSN